MGSPSRTCPGSGAPAAARTGTTPEHLASMLVGRRPSGAPLMRAATADNPVLAADEPADVDRGLMFLCYGASIEDQFEFLARRWADSPGQPNDGGHDPVIGQRDSGGDRERFIDVPVVEEPPVRIVLDQDWVVPTGGGYFVAPPIPALTTVLGGAS